MQIRKMQGGGWIKLLGCSKNFKNKTLAFSLIELSIVLIIIGLLVAGVTGGASLIQSAKTRALINEIEGYKRNVYTFMVTKDRLPGDVKNNGKIRNDKNDYIPSPFLYPYDGSNSEYGSPNEYTAPFVDLYLTGIIDFEPKKSDQYAFYNDEEIVSLPQVKNYLGSYYYFEEFFCDTEEDKDHVNYCMKEGRYLTINSYKKNMESKVYRNIDEKIDDGLYNDGIFRADCYGENPRGKNSYEKATKCRLGYYNIN